VKGCVESATFEKNNNNARLQQQVLVKDTSGGRNRVSGGGATYSVQTRQGKKGVLGKSGWVEKTPPQWGGGEWYDKS